MGMNGADGAERRFARQTCPVGRLIAARLAWAAPRAQPCGPIGGRADSTRRIQQVGLGVFYDLTERQ